LRIINANFEISFFERKKIPRILLLGKNPDPSKFGKNSEIFQESKKEMNFSIEKNSVHPVFLCFFLKKSKSSFVRKKAKKFERLESFTH
jgi:hypothetical protein